MKSKCAMASLKQRGYMGWMGGREGKGKGITIGDHVLVKIHTVISFYGWRSYQSIRRVNRLNHKYDYWLDQ